ncbi:hypothetical protein BLD25_02430 [Candidatus Gracilibacteria bacterium GN02-872]|nr:hypothetical protein BLD25_02430 [Candidatus Gracilibacteria bacterium GN02-872]
MKKIFLKKSIKKIPNLKDLGFLKLLSCKSLEFKIHCNYTSITTQFVFSKSLIPYSIVFPYDKLIST